MTTIQTQPTATTAEAATAPAMVAFDLYRDIHKGIRAELFSAVLAAGSADPGDVAGCHALAGQVDDAMTLLVDHAEHEDTSIQPAIEENLPEMAARIAHEHESLESRIESLRDQAQSLTGAGELRTPLHLVYLALADFTGEYLGHQDFEERSVMPALEAAIGVPAAVEIHQAIVGPMPPEKLARSLSVMLPAMNVEDRTELLGGIRDSAPAGVFELVWSLAESVLDSRSSQQLGGRLGI